MIFSVIQNIKIVFQFWFICIGPWMTHIAQELHNLLVAIRIIYRTTVTADILFYNHHCRIFSFDDLKKLSLMLPCDCECDKGFFQKIDSFKCNQAPNFELYYLSMCPSLTLYHNTCNKSHFVDI